MDIYSFIWYEVTNEVRERRIRWVACVRGPSSPSPRREGGNGSVCLRPTDVGPGWRERITWCDIADYIEMDPLDPSNVLTT